MDFDEYTAQSGPWKTIDGWNDQGAFTALRLINELQTEQGIIGNVGEIGVHEGQFFCALSLLTDKDNEWSLAVDVFDDQSRNVDKSGGSTISTFQKNTNRILTDRHENIIIIESDSLLVTTLRHVITNHANNGIVTSTLRVETDMFRLFSIDGGHTVVHVLNDLRLVERSMVPGGVVIVDDFMHTKWPGVTEGLHIYCTDRSSILIPFAYGNKKMYLSTPGFAKECLRHFLSCSENIVKSAARVELYGRELIWIDFR